MGYTNVGENENRIYLNNEVSLPNIVYNQNAWQFIKLDIIFVGQQAIFVLKSQVTKSRPLVPFKAISQLKSIHYGLNEGNIG